MSAMCKHLGCLRMRCDVRVIHANAGCRCAMHACARWDACLRPRLTHQLSGAVVLACCSSQHAPTLREQPAQLPQRRPAGTQRSDGGLLPHLAASACLRAARMCNADAADSSQSQQGRLCSVRQAQPLRSHHLQERLHGGCLPAAAASAW